MLKIINFLTIFESEHDNLVLTDCQAIMAKVQIGHSLNCFHTQSMDVDEDSTGHAE